MAYTAVPDEWIEAGKPTRTEIFQRLKDNQDLFDAQIQLLQGTAKIDMINVAYEGNINDYTVAQMNARAPVYRCVAAGSIVNFSFSLLEASGSGTLAIKLQKSTDNGANFSDILTAPVELTGTAAGSLSGAVSFPDIPSQQFQQNDMIRVEITGKKVNQGAFHVALYGELS